jgi:enoyl-CoA hydratase
MLDLANITLTRLSEHVAAARLNRPDRLNALTFPMFDELQAVQRAVDADPDIRALVLTGTGRGFCAGLDLDDASTLPGMPAAQMLTEQEKWAEATTGFYRMSTPVIAAVNGAAAGAGMGLALACDIRVAATSAKLNAAFGRIGLTGGEVGTSHSSHAWSAWLEPPRSCSPADSSRPPRRRR